jgi:ABC-type Zn uptake system ZnuABC Zn-binding protein ZnuA
MISGDFYSTKQNMLGKKIFPFFLVFFSILLLPRLHAQNSDAYENSDALRRIRIVTSIFPLLEFAEAVSGEGER